MKRVIIPTMTKFGDPGRPYSIVPLAIQGMVMLNRKPRMNPGTRRGYYRLTHIPTGYVLASYWDQEHTAAALNIAARRVPRNLDDLISARAASTEDQMRYLKAMAPMVRDLLDTWPVERDQFFHLLIALESKEDND